MSVLEKLRKAADMADDMDGLLSKIAEYFPINSRGNLFFNGESEKMTVLTQLLDRELRFMEISKLPCTCDCKDKSPSQNHSILCSRFMMDCEIPKEA